MTTFNLKEFKDNYKEHQFKIPSRIYGRLGDYKFVTFVTAANLYELSVKTVLTIHGVDNIMDIPFGKGLALASKYFFEAIEKADKEAAKKELERVQLKVAYLEWRLANEA